MMLIWFCRAHDLISNINAQVGAVSAPDPWTNASADCSHRQACDHALATLQSNCCPQVAIWPNDPMTPCHPASKHWVFKLKRVWTMLPRVAKAPEIQTIKLDMQWMWMHIWKCNVFRTSDYILICIFWYVSCAQFLSVCVVFQEWLLEAEIVFHAWVESAFHAARSGKCCTYCAMVDMKVCVFLLLVLHHKMI
jgi:hypothetical protein